MLKLIVAGSLLFATGTVWARPAYVYHLICNSSVHAKSPGRWGAQVGTYYKLTDCDAAAIAHKEDHGSNPARTQCSYVPESER